MKIRIARKVIKKWTQGLGNYTDNHFGVVIRASRKITSHVMRRMHKKLKNT